MTAPKRIQRRRTKGWRMPEGAVYVGRPSRWGNPFRMEHDPRALRPWIVTYETGTYRFAQRWDAARWAVASYRLWLAWPQQSALRRDIPGLAGYDLACWCPLEDAEGNRVPCHADVLLELANAEVPA